MENETMDMTYEEMQEAMTEDMDMETAEDVYVPRNRIVAAKENLYDKANLTVKQVDAFIALCVAAIEALVLFGM